MKRILIALILAASPAIAGGSYPEEAQELSRNLSRMDNASRFCKGITKSDRDLVWEFGKIKAEARGYDWDRIQRNARSRRMNPSLRLCIEVGTPDGSPAGLK